MDITLSPEVMTKLDNAVNECVTSMMRIEHEKDFQKDVVDRMKEEIDGFKPADFNALVKERLNDKISEKIAKLESVVELNDALIEHRRKMKNTVTQPATSDEADAEE